MFEPCAACTHECIDHFQSQDGRGHGIGCQVTHTDCPNFVRFVRED